ncbi:hypothetical protein OIO90_005428 [Microbotryomycetes sp. JL221]|nr:hypothetical protein OIO90_005428 [Microbotryomycetes sp. JL221]
MDPPVATLSPQSAGPSLAASVAGRQPVMATATRLPPISSLLASLDRGYEPSAHPRLIARNDDGGDKSTSSSSTIKFNAPWPPRQKSTTHAKQIAHPEHSAPPAPEAKRSPRQSERSSPPVAASATATKERRPSLDQTNQRRLPPISTTNLSDRQITTSIRDVAADDRHRHRSPLSAGSSGFESSFAGVDRPRMHLVSPTGGPLHPLPSGLVGFESTWASSSRTQDQDGTSRPRGNSASGTTASPLDEETTRRSSHIAWTTAHRDTRRASAPWLEQPVNTRKRSQDEVEMARSNNRPRTSLPGPDLYRTTYDSSFERQHIGSLARASFSTDAGSSSVTSSPMTNRGEGSRRGSAVDQMGSPDLLQSLVAVATSERHEMGAIHATHAHAHLSPELAGLRISSTEGWRGPAVPLPLQRRPSETSSSGPAYSWSASGPSSASAQSFSGQVPAASEDNLGELTVESGRYVCPHCLKSSAPPQNPP